MGFMIIGLTGRNGAGKGTAAQWFQARGFEFTSLSDAIRRDLSSRGLAPSRDNLIAAGRRLRREGGPGILARRCLEHIAAEGGSLWIVDSIRNPAEVEVLRSSSRFTLLEVVAPADVRYQRIVSRGRGGDATSFAEFQRQEEAELYSEAAEAQRLVATASLADVSVDNGADVATLEARLAALFPGVAAYALVQ